MLRINSYTAHGIERRSQRWMCEYELDLEDEVARLDELELEDVEDLVGVLASRLTRPFLRFPAGRRSRGRSM